MATQHQKAGMLIATLFLARDLAHREHLKVTGVGSYAVHDGATQGFYDAIVPLADTLAEAYMGWFKVELDIPLATQEGSLSFLDTIEAQLDYIHEARYDAIPRDVTCLHNVVDEIELLYAQTLFKLRRLQ